MLASFQPARCNAYVFQDALSNDILLRAYNSSQHLLFGFGSNNQSTLSLSKSNLSIPNGGFYSSNVGIGVTTPTADFRLHVAGSTRIEGDLVVNGDMTYINTDVQVTDQFTISNNGTGPALVVTQIGAQSIAEFRDDDTVVMKIFDGGFVTIGSNSPATKLDVEGDTTIRGIIYTSNVITSNVQTNSFTSTISTNLTTITSNLYSSNLIINGQTIINSNGVITNSNFLPPLNTSNIVAGQFTSNFIRDDDIISSKLASNLILKGTTTMSSNVFINNGELKILGSNNFLSTGHQARLFLGSNDYFIGAVKNVGMTIQVPGTMYPVILENITGFLGLGTMDPEENLHVQANSKVVGSHYVMTKLGVATSNPTHTVDVVGNMRVSDRVTLSDDLSISANNGTSSTDAGRQLYLRYSTMTGEDAAVIQSIDRSNLKLYNASIEASNIALGPLNALSNPTLYVQSGGKVGVQTSNPLVELDVKGQVNITNSNASVPSFTISNNTSPYMQLIGSNSALTLAASGGVAAHSADDSNGDVVIKNNQVVPTGRMFLQVGNASSAITINSNNFVGIGLSAPTFKLQVDGDVYASSNIRSSVGTLGPAFSLIPENAYADVILGNKFIFNKSLEAGNPATDASQPLFYGNSYLYQDASGENMAWNFARLIFRGCPLSTPASTSGFAIQDYVSARTPAYSNLTEIFTLSNASAQYGYVTYATPWFPASGSSPRSLALNYVSNSENVAFRIGQVQIQFKT